MAGPRRAAALAEARDHLGGGDAAEVADNPTADSGLAHIVGEAREGWRAPGELQAGEGADPAPTSPADVGERTAGAIDATAEAFSLDKADSTHLVAILRDQMLEIFRHRETGWGKMTQMQQQDVARSIESAAIRFASEAVKLIAAQGQIHITAMLEGYSDKGGDVKGTLKFVGIDDEAILALHKASGKRVILVTADEAAYRGARPAKLDPDQPDLVFDGTETDLAGEWPDGTGAGAAADDDDENDD